MIPEMQVMQIESAMPISSSARPSRGTRASATDATVAMPKNVASRSRRSNRSLIRIAVR